MAAFENRSGVYVQVHEHRKRRKLPIASRHHLNLNIPLGEVWAHVRENCLGKAVASWWVGAFVMLAAGGSHANAEANLDRWRFSKMDDGLATASLPAANKLMNSSGVLSYSPVLTIACRIGGDPHWSEWLRLNDAVSSGSTITMSVSVDEALAVDERWSATHRGKVLVRSGPEAVSRLLSADRLVLSWRFGLLSGRAEADFDLAGIAEAVRQLAEACQTSRP